MRLRTCTFTRTTLAIVPRAPAGELHRWDPKDGELCRGRVKSQETAMEARSRSDVQIDGAISVQGRKTNRTI